MDIIADTKHRYTWLLVPVVPCVQNNVMLYNIIAIFIAILIHNAFAVPLNENCRR